MNKVAVVTGSTKGIGLATTLKLLSEGYFVFMSYCNDDSNANIVSEELKVEYDGYFQIDKVDLTDYLQTMEYITLIKIKVSAIDVLILNATVTDRRPFEEMTFESFERIMRANVSIPFLLVQQLVGELSKGYDKSVVFIGSIMGAYPHAMSIAYGVSKSAEHSLTTNFVKFLEPYGIRSNAVCPGFVETEMQKDKPQSIRDSICNKVALHRFAQVPEIVDAIWFVIRYTYINGELLNIFGGYSYK